MRRTRSTHDDIRRTPAASAAHLAQRATARRDTRVATLLNRTRDRRRRLVTSIVTARAATLAVLSSLLVGLSLVAANTTVANATTATTTAANTTTASGYVDRCSANDIRNLDKVQACVRKNGDGTFQAYANVVFPTYATPVNVFVQQCRGDGTVCGFVAHGSGVIIGHKFLFSSKVAGVHGHSYRAVVYAGVTQQWRVISPFIPYP
jgi:hypothetical protein